MQFKLLRTLPAIAVLCFATSYAMADVVAQFNYNAASSPGNASIGTGTTSGAFFPFTSALPVSTGSPTDTNLVDIGGTLNNGSAPRSGPQPLEAPGGRAVTWSTSLAGFEAPSITFDMLGGYRVSRYYQISATTDGSTFIPVSGGIGSSGSGIFGSYDISSDGLIDFRAVDGLIDDETGTGYMEGLSYTFAPSTYTNQPNFGVRIAAVWEPGGTDFVSSFAGTTNAADPVSGYIRSTSLGGSQTRYDVVTITASVPEPTSLLLVASGLGMLATRRRNR